MYEVALAFSVLSFCLVLGYFSRQEGFSVFHPLSFYLAFHGLVFVIRPIFAYVEDYRSIYVLYQFTPSIADKTTVICAATLGMFSFAFFALQTGNVAMQFKQDRFAISERNGLVPAALWAIAICGLIGAYSLFVMWSRATVGLNDMVRDAATGTAINTSNNGYLVESQLMLATCCVMLGWFFRFRLIALLPLLGFVVFRAGTGGRGPFITAAVSLGLIYLYEHRRRFPSVRVMAFGTAIALLFMLVGADRGGSIRSLVNKTDQVQVETEKIGSKTLEGMDFANMEYFEFLVYAVPQRTGTYEYFADNLILFTEPIPRVLWSGKPIGSPVQFFKLFDYGFPIGMTRSLPGEGWTQLGWAGVIIWCGLWGAVLGYVYRRFALGTQSAFAVMFYFSFIPIFIIAYRDGLLATIFRQGVFFLAPVLVWRLIASYLGLPSAQDLRAHFIRTERKRELAGNGEPAAVLPSSGLTERQDGRRPRADRTSEALHALPPAARRRRARLRKNPDPGAA